MKTITPLIFFFTLVLYFPATGFQLADATPPAPETAEKYIFYWGTSQCELTKANDYKSNLSVSAEEFRQMMLNPPRVWNGKELAKQVSFNLDEFSLNSAEYLSKLPQLDAFISTKLILGNTIKINKLTLSEGIFGAIDCLIVDAKEGFTASTGFLPGQRKGYLNTFLVDRVVWGREDILETSNRDFFTVREFWQTIRQEPFVEWQFNQKPHPLRCVIGLNTKDKTALDIVANLEEQDYNGLLENLEPYRHMVHPGGFVELKLQTVGQYELLYKKNMVIVADDDPRLRLRGKLDYHKVAFEWGDWSDVLFDLYLLEMTNSAGERFMVDPPITSASTMTFSGDSLSNWGNSKPECKIDGVAVSANISLRVVVNDSLPLWIQTRDYNKEAVKAFFKHPGLTLKTLKIDSIAVEGYTLPPMTYVIRLVRMRNGLSVPQDFTALQNVASSNSKARLFPPDSTLTDLVFKIELEAKSNVVFSVYEPDGMNVIIEDNTFDAGMKSLHVPKSFFRLKGKHFAFLNTEFGAIKLEFNVE